MLVSEEKKEKRENRENRENREKVKGSPAPNSVGERRKKSESELCGRAAGQEEPQQNRAGPAKLVESVLQNFVCGEEGLLGCLSGGRWTEDTVLLCKRSASNCQDKTNFNKDTKNGQNPVFDF